MLGRALTDFRLEDGWNPSASSGRVLPLPQARGRSAGRWGRGLGCVQAVGRMCSVLGRMCSVFGPMCSLSGRMCSLWRGEVFSFRWRALVGDRGRRAGETRSFGKLRTGFDKLRAGSSAGSGQVSLGTLGMDGDVSTLSGQCVQFLARCVNFSAECVQFLGGCVQFRGGCRPLWRGMCPVVGGAPWLGMGRRTQGEIPPSASSGQASAGSGQVRFGRLAMNARGVGSQGCGPGFDLTGRR